MVVRDDGAVRGTLHLLDGVDGGQRHDRGAAGTDGFYGARDGVCVDEGTNCVVDQHDIVIGGGDGGERPADGFLARIAALNHGHTAGESMVKHLRLDPLHFGGAHGHDDGADPPAPLQRRAGCAPGSARRPR